MEIMRDEVGSAFQIALSGFQPAVLVGPDSNRQIMVSQREHFHWRSPSDPVTKLLRHGGLVVPLFVFDPVLLASEWVAPQRVAFLVEGLRLLDADLQKRGSRLLVRYGRPEVVLPQVVDAAMRQLLAIGWMHNRARMIAASLSSVRIIRPPLLIMARRVSERWRLTGENGRQAQFDEDVRNQFGKFGYNVHTSHSSKHHLESKKLHHFLTGL